MALKAAHEIVRETGGESLTARKVAERIGYTVGTLYQVFGNMDDLVQQMNGETLDLLLAACRTLPDEGTVQGRLVALSAAFVDFARRHPEEWRMVVSYRYGPKHAWRADYDARVVALLGLMADATRVLYGEDEKELQADHMRVLWASLYGAFALDVEGRLGQGRSVEAHARCLIDFYLAERRIAGHGDDHASPKG